MIPVILLLLQQRTCSTPSCWLIPWEYEKLLPWSYLYVGTRSREPGELETPLWKFWSKATIESISLKDNILLHTGSQVLLCSLSGEKGTKVGGHAGTEVSSQIGLGQGEGGRVQFSLQHTHTRAHIYIWIYIHIKENLQRASWILSAAAMGRGCLLWASELAALTLSSSAGSLSRSPFASTGQNKLLAC